MLTGMNNVCLHIGKKVFPALSKPCFTCCSIEAKCESNLSYLLDVELCTTKCKSLKVRWSSLSAPCYNRSLKISGKRLALKIAGLVFITTLIASLMSPCDGYRRGSRICNNNCPSDWFTAEYASLLDVTLPQNEIQFPDPNFTFFKDVLLFSDEKIQTVTQDAMEFFRTRYGLDFSQVTPNELGQRFLGSAIFAPSFLSPEARYTVNVNWRLNTLQCMCSKWFKY